MNMELRRYFSFHDFKKWFDKRYGSMDLLLELQRKELVDYHLTLEAAETTRKL